MTKNTEYEFLPAALEIQETPPSPIGRWIVWVIGILFLLAVIWAIFGKIDIVAVAQGKIIHSGHSKVIQPLQPGVIRAIYVKEGQNVLQGDVLIELDSTETQAQFTQLEDEQFNLRTERTREQFFLDIINQHKSLTELDTLKLPKQHQLLVKQTLKAFQSNTQTLNDSISKSNSEINMIDTQIEKYNELLPILSKKLAIYEKLSVNGSVSKVETMRVQTEYIESKQALAAEMAKRQTALASIQEIKSRIANLHSETQSKSLQRITEISSRLRQLESELVKSKQQQTYQIIKSPIDGTIQQLEVHTLGGVVTTAQPLMVIVPQHRELIAEAKLLNKDIGFVYEKQMASVKVDAFNFTKYGLIDGQLVSISEQAIEDENLGLVYSARVKLSENKLNIDGKWVSLSPGMSVAVEIKTGQRRLIEYFLSPILRYKQESIKER